MLLLLLRLALFCIGSGVAGTDVVTEVGIIVSWGS